MVWDLIQPPNQFKLVLRAQLSNFQPVMQITNQFVFYELKTNTAYAWHTSNGSRVLYFQSEKQFMYKLLNFM